MEYDVFLCHASEDKDFVGRLANALTFEGLSVWYDRFTLKIGDSLRAAIDHGLSNCEFGIVVLSHDFFRKDWPNWELDGLLAAGRPRILPLWHGVSRGEVLNYSPSLVHRR